MNKIIRNTAVSLCMTLLAGCSSLVVAPVSESSRTNSDAYDGRWLVTVVSTASKQHLPGGWVFTCPDRAGERIGLVVVNDGQAQMSWDEKGETPAFVNNRGKFRLEVPTGIVAAASSGSDSSISRGDMTALLYGSLKTGKGNFTLGVAEFANAGCTSKVEFKPVS